MGVRLAGVRKSYRRRGEVLAGIDLELTPGRPVLVVGGNGTGKSTLLRIAAGASAPTAGSVTGRPRVVGFLPGRVPASTRMPARAYLRHMAAVHGVRQDAGALLGDLGFSGDLDAPVARLSTGNVQKVLLVQALGCGAGLLVLDEPWSGLDAGAAAALDRLLAVAAATTAVLVADHTGRAAQQAGAAVFRLSRGVLAPEAVAPPGAAHTVVELSCPGDPAEALRGLPDVRESWLGVGSLTVRVPVDRGDGLLAAALARGCSVLSVRREEARR
ncbi:ABC-type multidrug transport system ATPase subunit [Pseudonocardia hierapolitana]|uniref:ABC-type multidrug transport system ATPase subunit n=1 Tax=Pseudonocardia hierapolitana TaxID=1128676 RepID=A0A561SPE6_9PSEU|nr:ATP-binding cassette domain-containing protein [Pseudonocardia hierapolitana]TWF76732.1 ABC-type multidrug transport system ATPase subunit [Pseudonocardia hierapolitana]